MCMVLAGVAGADKLSQAFGMDPFGTRARDKEDLRTNREENWAREDMMMDKQHAHELKMADKKSQSGTKSSSSKNYGGGM